MREPLILEKFIASCKQLNTKILEPYLSENVILNGLDKYSFLSYLHELFTEARSNEVINVVKVNKYCLTCHPNTQILEFYSKEREVDYYRNLPSIKKLIPVFAFAIINDSKDNFDLEQCFNSWGNTIRKRYIDEVELRKLIC